MSFLSTAFLVALPLVAAPLLLHLFDRRRKVEIAWGAMQFLTDAAAPRTSPRRLRQWLLLLLRTLAVAALIFALARPMTSLGWLSQSNRTETVIVIDNSMSMTRNDTDGTLMQQAIQIALDELDELRPADRIRLMTAAPYPVWHDTVDHPSTAHHDIADQISGLTATQGRSDLLAALMTAVQTESDPSCNHRRIIVLSDGQSSDWRADDQLGWQRFRTALADARIPTELETIQLQCTAPARGNVSVDRLTATANRVGIDQAVSLTAQLHHRGIEPSPTTRVHWVIDGQAIDPNLVQAVDQAPIQEVHWMANFTTPGPHRVECRIDVDDDLPADNQAAVVIEVVEQIPVLIVEADGPSTESQQDAFFVQAALGWFDDQPLEDHSVHTPTVVAPHQIGNLPLDRFHAVVIPNLTQIEPAAVNALSEYVMGGGGLWVGLGPRTDIDAFNQHWFASGNALAPLAIDRIIDHQPLPPAMSDSQASQGSQQQQFAPTTINPFSGQHPATKSLSDNQQLDLNDVRVDRRFKFATAAQDKATSVLLRLSNGEALVVEKLLGQGRIIVQAVPLQMQWSNLTQSQSFVVMVREFLNYLSQPKGTRFNLQPGDPLVMRTSNDQTRSATLIDPLGNFIELTADRDRAGWAFRTSRTSIPGNYQLELGLVGNSLPFHVSRDLHESDLTPLNDQQRKLLSDLTGAQPTGDQRLMIGTAPADPLWPYLLVALIGLITGDLLLSGIFSRERFGSDAVQLPDGTSSRGNTEMQHTVSAWFRPPSATPMAKPMQGSSHASSPQATS